MTDEVTPIPREARPYQGQRAGLVSRCIANLIDSLVVGAALVIGYVGLNGLLFIRDPQGFDFLDLSIAVIGTVALAVTIVYFTGAWAITGRTYGCHVMGLRVVNARGDRLAPAVSLVRANFCVFFPIGLLWCAVSPNGRSVQDVVLRTAVIYDWLPRASGRDHQS